MERIILIMAYALAYAQVRASRPYCPQCLQRDHERPPCGATHPHLCEFHRAIHQARGCSQCLIDLGYCAYDTDGDLCPRHQRDANQCAEKLAFLASWLTSPYGWDISAPLLKRIQAERWSQAECRAQWSALRAIMAPGTRWHRDGAYLAARRMLAALAWLSDEAAREEQIGCGFPSEWVGSDYFAGLRKGVAELKELAAAHSS
jgi:hypothetical protein